MTTTTQLFNDVFPTRRGADHSYWCERQDLSRAELLSARLGVPTYRVRSTTQFLEEIEGATVTDAARALLRTQWRTTNTTDNNVYVVALALMTEQPVRHSTIDAVFTDMNTSPDA
jgi:hypothetical protein